MGQEIGRTSFDASDFARYRQHLQAETSMLRRYAEQGGFADTRRVAGFELEAWLLDHAGYPTAINEAYLRRLDDPLVVPELSRYNVEINVSPQSFRPGALLAMETELAATCAKAQGVAHDMDAVLATIGIPPTLRQADLSIGTMSAVNRYRVLNEQVLKQRGGQALHIHIAGVERLDMDCLDVMLEAATTSFQVHFQVPEADSGRYYNASLIACAPLLAASTNSPLLFGQRLWRETRIPVFEQSVDVGGHGGLADTRVRRVSFGQGYVARSMLELYEENLRDFPVLLPMPLGESAATFPHLRLHNGSIWRWVRPLLGFDDEGMGHVRIEQRVLPSGPSLLDMLANAAFYFGLTQAWAQDAQPPEERLPHEVARQNFYLAARDGLGAELAWLDGRRHAVTDVLRGLLPLAEEGLADLGLEDQEVARYLGVFSSRVAARQTGADWQLAHWRGDTNDLPRLMADYLENQRSGAPVHEWPS